jgi:hypothetical protein
MHDPRPKSSLAAGEPSAAPNTTCSACGDPLHCGARAGGTSCWCASWPPLKPVTGETCLCARCLTARIEAQREPGSL